MEGIILPIATVLILPIVFSLFDVGARREEAKIIAEYDFKVTGSKSLRLFFLVWTMLCFLGMVGIFIYNFFDAFWQGLIIAEIIILVFALIGLFGYIYVRGNYVVAKKEHIVVKKPFNKPFIVKYEDIAYSNCVGVETGAGGYEFLDKDGVKLFSCEFLSVGISNLVKILASYNVQPIPRPYPTQEMKQNPRFIEYRKKGAYKFKMGCFLAFGIFLACLCALTFSQVSLKEFENKPVTGVVQSSVFHENSIKFKLENDQNEYYINNVVYEKINKQTTSLLIEGASIELTTARVRENGSIDVSSLKIGDTVCLTIDDAYNAEYNNYLFGLIFEIVALCVAIVLIILYFITLLKYNRYKKILNNSKN